eukprot:73586-Amphidinium_carterae.1
MLNPGIFPATDHSLLTASIATEFASFKNHSSAEDSEITFTEMERLVTAGYVNAYDDLESCSSCLGQRPVLSPLGLISKQVVAPDGSVRDKHRLILDCKASQ